MNIALERCKEVAEGRVTRNWGDAFVRGNNGMQTDAYSHHQANFCSHIYMRRQRMIRCLKSLDRSKQVFTLVNYESRRYHTGTINETIPLSVRQAGCCLVFANLQFFHI